MARLLGPQHDVYGLLRDMRHDGPPPGHLDTDTPLQARFWNNTDRVIHKWHHYLPIYERHFAAFRGQAPTVIEVGVQHGGALKMWRDYFGPEARLFGLDIDPACARVDGEAGRVMIGSQADPAFLASVLAETGPPHVVIDDGSHVMDHIRATLAVLFPALQDGGVYLIEDLHCAYWPGYGGGLKAPGNFFNDVRMMIDDLHAPYHGGKAASPVSAALTGLHVYDSIVVLDKGVRHPPRHSVRGQERLADWGGRA